jgi:predicted permease
MSYFIAVKLVATPAIALALVHALGLAGVLPIVMLFAALPTASSAYILAARMGARDSCRLRNHRQTLLAMLTLPIAISLAP